MAEIVTCGVCEDNPSKYKCPHCTTRYCSIPCFKKHIAEHEATTDDKNHEQDTTLAVDRDGPTTLPSEGTLAAATTSDTTVAATPLAQLPNDPRFSQLLKNFPSLKPALRRIYRATLHPQTQLDTRNEAALQQSATTDDCTQQEHNGGQAGHEDEDEDEQALERQWGAAPDFKRWTASRAEQRALKLLTDLQGRNDGVAEFVELVRIVVLAPLARHPMDTTGSAVGGHETIAGSLTADGGAVDAARVV